MFNLFKGYEKNSTQIDKAKSVIVVGGGLVGLSAAIFLRERGVPTILVEKHLKSSEHPRAIGFTTRTMELYRAAGLEDKIPQIPANASARPRRIRVESLAGKWEEESVWTPGNQQVPTVEASPCRGAAIAQDRLESILRERAIELNTDIRLGTELISFQQNADGITALLRDHQGEKFEVQAAYMIAADGHRSPIREMLGITRDGRGYMRTVRSVLFKAPLEEYLQKGITQFDIDSRECKAFLTTYGDGRWVLMFSDDQERDEENMRTMIYKAIGRSNIDIQIITTGRWELSALIANNFSSGRVFLAGDAAHTLPPNRGGYGANTGIEDVHNLAWKLASVLSGHSKSGLLDTYDAERRPIAWLRHDQIFARPDYKAHAVGASTNTPIIDDLAMELGQLYKSNAILGIERELAPAMRPEQWLGQPGTRAPHASVLCNGEQVSTLDLFQRTWVLLADDDQWNAAVIQATNQLGIRLKLLSIGNEIVVEDREKIRTAFGFEKGGASLIRPDGYIAWRSVDLPTDPLAVLTDAFSKASFATRADLEDSLSSIASSKLKFSN